MLLQIWLNENKHGNNEQNSCILNLKNPSNTLACIVADVQNDVAIKTKRTWHTQTWIFCQNEIMTGARAVGKICCFPIQWHMNMARTDKHYISMPTEYFLFNHNRRLGVRVPAKAVRFYCHLFYHILSKMRTSRSFNINHWSDFAGHYDHKKQINGDSYAYQDSLLDFASHCSQ